MIKLRLLKPALVAVLMLPLMSAVEVVVVDSQQAAAQQRKATRVESIRQKHIKTFEKIQAAFEEGNTAQVSKLLDKLEKEEDLNNIERAYIYNYRGNIFFGQDNLSAALRQFKKIIALPEGVPPAFSNQMLYVIAQVLFSQEKYREALDYAQRWFGSQADPTADAYMLISQAHYQLKDYDKALPNVQKGIQKYIELGSVPKEGWLNLLSSIYRNKSQYKKMVPVLKQLVQHYPKKTYLLTLAGVYNELNDQASMTAMYRAMYSQNLLSSESELVTLASLLLSKDNAFQAASIIEKGLDNGAIKKEQKNYRLYSQALYVAREYEKALSPLSKAASLAKDGKIYEQLGQSYIALNRWGEGESALKRAINKGGLRSTGQTYLSLGLTQFEQKKFKTAKATFTKALKYDKVIKDAKNWIRYVDSEVKRLKALEEEIIIDTSVEPKSSN